MYPIGPPKHESSRYMKIVTYEKFSNSSTNKLNIRSIGLWWWNGNITNTILDIIHRPVFYLKRDVSEIQSSGGTCLVGTIR
jgi:hypothetical protein